MKEKEGKNHGYKGKGAVKDHLYISKGISEPLGNSPYQSFSGKHDHIGPYFQRDAKGHDNAADCQIDDGIYIGSSILCGDDKESGVNAEGKQQGSRDLHRLHKGKPAADQCFSQYKEHIKTEGIDTHGGSRNQAQDKRYAGYGRSPKTSSGDKTDPQGADQHTGRKNKIVFTFL